MKSEKTAYQLLIIDKIKKLREEQNISQVQICDIIGLNSVGQVGNIESPKFKHKYTLKQIYLLASHFNYAIEKLFLEENDLENHSEIINKLIIKLIEYEQ